MKIIFTKHAEKRVKNRGIPKQEVIDSIKYPDRTIKKHGMYYFQKRLAIGPAEVVCEKKGKILKVITVYWI